MRTSWFVYHPSKHGDKNQVYDSIRLSFSRNLESAIEVTETYAEEMPAQPKVFTDDVKKSIQKILKEIDKKRDVYLLESLSEYLYPDQYTDRNRKFRKTLPTFKEIQERALEIRADDSGILFKNPVRELLI